MGRTIWVAVAVTLAVMVSQAKAETPAASPDKTAPDKTTTDKPTDKSAAPTTRSTVPYKPGASDVDGHQAPRRRAIAPEGDSGPPEGPAQSEQCAWIGKRIVGLLVRDDAMGANDFIPFYQRFQCPEEHLSKAFACVVANLPTIENNALGDQVDECWHDPRIRFEAVPKSDAGKDNGQHKDADPGKTNGKPSSGPS